MIYKPMLSAEQQFVVDEASADSFWEYWLDRHRNHQDTTQDGYPIIRNRGTHYVFRTQKDPASSGNWLGYGGAQFEVRKANGTVLRSNDVWCQGTIPLVYRQLLPDNAEDVQQVRSQFQAHGTAEEATLRQLSAFDHPTLAIDFHKARREEVHDDKVYTTEFDETTRRPAPLEESQVWTSEVRNVPQPDDSLTGWSGGGFREVSMDLLSSPPVIHTSDPKGPKATRFDGRMEQVQDGWHTVMLDIDQPVRLVPSTTPGHWHLYIDVAMPWWRYRYLLKALKIAGIIEDGYYRASVKRGFTSLRLPWVKKEDMTPPPSAPVQVRPVNREDSY